MTDENRSRHLCACGERYTDECSSDTCVLLGLGFGSVSNSPLDLAQAAEAVVKSWDSSTYNSDRPDHLSVRVNRKAWAAFCELVEGHK